ncbi:MAG: HAD family hydrolase [Proteobacteria bacterium]|nr:HAD family hydrolase [Pseudomonadota bacterium]
MGTDGSLVFLFDVDNTLFDNDALQRQLTEYLTHTFGTAVQARYWALFEELRDRLGYADYLGALERLRLERPDDPLLLQAVFFFSDYPFREQLYPGALEALEHCARLGRTVILSDGDAVFQPLKVRGAGLWAAVQGHVLIYVHKERMLDEVQRRYPGAHYVLVDDKVRILAAVKQAWGAKVTTVFPRQGHYALDAAEVARHPPPDVNLGGIGELASCSLGQLSGAPAAQKVP